MDKKSINPQVFLMEGHNIDDCAWEYFDEMYSNKR